MFILIFKFLRRVCSNLMNYEAGQDFNMHVVRLESYTWVVVYSGINFYFIYIYIHTHTTC